MHVCKEMLNLSIHSFYILRLHEFCVAVQTCENAVQKDVQNGLTKRTLLHDIDSIGAEINRYLNECDKNRHQRLCKYYLKGTCWFGDHCWYRHETSSLSRPPTPQPKKGLYP